MGPLGIARCERRLASCSQVRRLIAVGLPRWQRQPKLCFRGPSLLMGPLGVARLMVQRCCDVFAFTELAYILQFCCDDYALAEFGDHGAVAMSLPSQSSYTPCSSVAMSMHSQSLGITVHADVNGLSTPCSSVAMAMPSQSLGTTAPLRCLRLHRVLHALQFCCDVYALTEFGDHGAASLRCLGLHRAGYTPCSSLAMCTPSQSLGITVQRRCDFLAFTELGAHLAVLLRCLCPHRVWCSRGPSVAALTAFVVILL
jgi:hypothetical protein